MFYAATIHRRMSIDTKYDEDMVVHRGLIVGATSADKYEFKKKGKMIYQQDDDVKQKEKIDLFISKLFNTHGKQLLRDRNPVSTSPLLELCLRNDKNEQAEFDKLVNFTLE